MTPEQQMLDDIARRLIAAWQAKEKAAETKRSKERETQ